jgi:cyclopropane fatty-acyl-phospholipid synthase-like methyltransferase
MVWIHAISESAADELCEGVLNPMSPDKFRTLGHRLRLSQGERVLDIGAGTCGPALILAREFGCRVTAVEPLFMDAARKRVAEAGLSDQFELFQSAGADFDIEAGRYDVAMCIGADFAWGGYEGTIRAMAPGVREGGHVIIGTVYHVDGQNSRHAAPEHTLDDLLETFEDNGLNVVSVIRSTRDDLDTYASVHATSLLDWLEANPGHPDSEQVGIWRRQAVEEFTTTFGWAVVAGRKPAT